MTKLTQLALVSLLFASSTASARDAAWCLAPSISATFAGAATSKYLVLPYGDMNLTFQEDNQVLLMTTVIGHPHKPFARHELAKLSYEYFQNTTGLQLSTLKKAPDVATINSHCPSGIELKIADKHGTEYHWVTIVDGKLYIVQVKTNNPQALTSPAVKAFLASVTIDSADKK